MRSQSGSLGSSALGNVAARFAYPIDDHEFLHVCAQMSPTSVPNTDVGQSSRVNGSSPYTASSAVLKLCILSSTFSAVSGSKAAAHAS